MNTFYNQPFADTARQLDTSLEHGLAPTEVQQRLAEHGENSLPARKRTPWWQLLFAQFKDFVVLLLVAASLISFLLGDTLEGIAILVIVLLNAVISLIQEKRADAAMEALQKLAAPDAHVLRGGARQTVPARGLVPGDIVFLEAGNYVPADMQLVESANLKINEAALTGESEAATKDAEPVVALDAPIGDRVNMAFSSTLVTQGRARGIVTATALKTEIGQIARMMSEIKEELTPLQRRLNQMGKTLSLIALGLCALVFVVQLARRTDLGLVSRSGLTTYLQTESAIISEVFILAVSLAVAAVPEGLSAVVTINLAMGMRELVKRHALVRRLNAVETLGSTTVICTDKTGTLTQNVMTVVRVFAGGVRYRVTGERYDPDGSFIEDASGQTVAFGPQGLVADHPLMVLLRGGMLSSDAILEKHDGQYRMVGDATEGALVVAAAKAGLWRADTEKHLPRVDEVVFDADRKMMTTLHQPSQSAKPDAPESKIQVFTKGAPGNVLAHCNALLTEDNQTHPLTQQDRDSLQAVTETMGGEALRVLAVAMRNIDAIPQTVSEVENDLVFVGLLGMIDPPRPEVAAAIQLAREAGIRTVMITGDYPVTAGAIAKQIGLMDAASKEAHEPRIVSGPELAAMSDDALTLSAKDVNVFARVSPEHKVRIVSAMKRNNQVVAMTGDGINDAPALKQADIGIAMGITGSDVSKETADMVLTDDNFASIVHAVEQGRVIYANIRKFVFFLLGCNIAEILILLVATLLGLKSPLTAIQLLWLNLLTDGAPALALGLEKGEPNLMRQPPHPVNEPIINGRMVRQLVVQTLALVMVVLGVYVFALRQMPVQAQTLAFVTLALAELPLAYTARSERSSVFQIGLFSNAKMQWAVLVSVMGVLLITYVPLFNQIFGTVPLGLVHWVWVLPASLIPAVLAELIKHRYVS